MSIEWIELSWHYLLFNFLNMNPSHYPSLELCKKLTEIGFPDTENIRYEDDKKWIWYNSPECYEWDYVCPSVMEMLDVMPMKIMSDSNTVNAFSINGWIWPDTWPYLVGYHQFKYTKDINLANALAEMILWLHNNKYITF